jgi:hypothetical protein
MGNSLVYRVKVDGEKITDADAKNF